MRIIYFSVCSSHSHIPISKGSVRVTAALIRQKIGEAKDGCQYMLLPITNAGNTDKPLMLFCRWDLSKYQMPVSKKAMKQEAVIAQMPVGGRQESKIL